MYKGTGYKIDDRLPHLLDSLPNSLNILGRIALLVACLSINQATAQDPTASEGVHLQQNRERFRIEQQIQQATSPFPGIVVTSPQLPPTDALGKSQQKIFKLNQVLFDPPPRSLSPSELESITAKYIAMDMVSFYDLYLMVVEIDALFDRKQILGRAGLPVQEIENGIITVQIIEGRESRRTLTLKTSPCLGFGDSPLFPCSSDRLFGRSFVQRQFHFSGRNAISLPKLEDEILRYNRTFRSQLVAEIEPGDDLGDCTLKLTRIMPQPISGGYSVDNSGRETSGRIRQTAYVNLSDVLGMNDSFFVSYDKTEGTSGLYMQGDIPVSRCGTFFDMSYYYGEPKTISGPFALLNINGTSEQYRPGIRQILVNEKERRWDATMYYQNYHSQTFFDTALNYEEKHDALTMGLEYSRRQKKSALFAGLSLVTGQARTLAAEKYTDGDFNLLKMNLMKIWYPHAKWTLILRGNGNAALTALPQSQVFQIGGMATVRGTPEAMMSGDSGYLVSTEVRHQIWSGCDRNAGCSVRCSRQQSVCDYLRKDRHQNSRGEIFAFFDHGGVFYQNPVVSPSDFLTSMGAGATVNIGKHCSFSGGYGQPIFIEWSHTEAYRALLQQGNAFFTVRVSF